MLKHPVALEEKLKHLCCHSTLFPFVECNKCVIIEMILILRVANSLWLVAACCRLPLILINSLLNELNAIVLLYYCSVTVVRVVLFTSCVVSSCKFTYIHIHTRVYVASSWKLLLQSLIESLAFLFFFFCKCWKYSNRFATTSLPHTTIWLMLNL